MHGLKDRPPKLAEWLLKRFLLVDECHEKLGDFEEGYHIKAIEKGKHKAFVWYWLQLIMTIPVFVKNLVYWRSAMLKNHLKLAFRIIKKHKGHSLINIFALAVGFACCILILLYIHYELNYDKFHKNYPDIYRILKKRPGEKFDNSTSSRLAPALKENFPEVLAATRVNKIEGVINFDGKSLLEDRIFFVDQGFLDVFTFPVIAGNPESALDDPFSVLITEDMAEKYFGNKDPLGQTISISDENRFDKFLTSSNRHDYKVTGILKNVPQNSHIKFDFLASFSSMEALRGKSYMNRWDAYLDRTYVLLSEYCNPDELEQKVEQYLLQSDVRTKYCLQSLGDIHLFGNLNTELEPNSDISYIYLFSALAFFIMLISCFNYVNLTTARAAHRAKEVGMRKVVGAERRQIVHQFLGESGVFTFIAVIVSFGLVKMTLPAFKLLINRDLSFADLISSHMLPLLFGIVVLAGIGSGIYPAIFFSSFRPIRMLKGTLNTGTKGSSFLKNSILTTQFFISTVMVIATMTVYHQLHYIRNKNLGYNKDLVLAVNIKDDNLRNNFAPLMNELRQNPRILSISASSSLPNNIDLSYTTRWENMGDLRPFDTYVTFIDSDFVDFYGLKITRGRNFYHDFGKELKNAYIINETANMRLGWDESIGKRINLSGREGIIIGIIEDFHFQPLHNEIEPLALGLYQEGINFFPYNGIEYFSMRISSTNIPNTLSVLKRTFKKFSPDYPFEYSFLDDNFEKVYKSEQKLGQAFSCFALISIFITCLGLFSLSSFTVEKRTKEIGIRKVLGSSIPGIFLLLTKESARWILLGNIIAWPVAYFAMNKWLQNFAYRTGIGIWTFAIPTALVLTIALCTISYQTIKAATANPVDSLRYE